MDIGLEFVDRYLFDKVYATLLPAKQPANFFNQTGAPWDAKAASPWNYKPASELLSFAPTDAAYQSSWTRDNIYRQLVTLYLVTW